MSYILVSQQEWVLLEGDEPVFGSDPCYASRIRRFDSAAEAWAIADLWPAEHRDRFEVLELLEAAVGEPVQLTLDQQEV